jgi:catechol-2,3-dioxygenase
MKNYSIEHIGITVGHPIEMASWYKDVFGFNIGFSAQHDDTAVAFVTDGENKVMLELGKIPGIEPLRNRTNHHLQFHIALKSDDPDSDVIYLTGKGAKFIEKCPVTRASDYLIVMEDPWGNCIQLAKRNPQW